MNANYDRLDSNSELRLKPGEGIETYAARIGWQLGKETLNAALARILRTDSAELQPNPAPVGTSMRYDSGDDDDGEPEPNAEASRQAMLKRKNAAPPSDVSEANGDGTEATGDGTVAMKALRDHKARVRDGWRTYSRRAPGRGGR